ncbi:MAG TPA: hypothetical protein VGI14_01475, partial [Casimicrobiaceae bacterium]
MIVRMPASLRKRWIRILAVLGVAAALTAAVALLLTTAGNAAPDAGPDRVVGWRVPLGQGDVASYADLEPSGAPRTLGIAISGQ